MFRDEAMDISDRSASTSRVFSYGFVNGGYGYAFLVTTSAGSALALRSLFDHFITAIFLRLFQEHSLVLCSSASMLSSTLSEQATVTVPSCDG